MFAVGFLALAAAAGRGPSQPSVLKVANAMAATVEVRVNGQRLKLRVDPAANGDVTLNPDAARRSRLQPSRIPVTGLIGPVKVHGQSATSEISMGPASARATFIWYDQTITQGADGVISPGLLPYDEVHLLLGPSRSDETTTAIPVHFSRDYGLAQAQSVAGNTLLVRFAVSRRDSISTAAAAAILSYQFSGSWIGEVTPFTMKLGVQRPVRSLALGKTWLAGPFSITKFLVRTGDWRGDHALPSEAQDDSGKIVVWGKTRSLQKPVYQFVVGRDHMSRCSSVIYSKAKGTLEFTCEKKQQTFGGEPTRQSESAKPGDLSATVSGPRSLP